MDKNDFDLSLVMNSVVHQEVLDLDRPHVVVCRDILSGSITLSGPFPDGLSALIAAEEERTSTNALLDASFAFSVRPLLPAWEPQHHEA